MEPAAYPAGTGRTPRHRRGLPVLHGTFGEDGTMQGLLELAGLPYVGAGVMASAVSMDKEMMKRVCRERLLPIVEYVTVTRDCPNIEDACRCLRFPRLRQARQSRVLRGNLKGARRP
jgi:D-alanine-D-alanine ligase-like ATP-grasp enzyme